MNNPRLLIPNGLKPSSVRGSRIDAPVRKLAGATMGTGWSLSFAAKDDVATSDVMSALDAVFAQAIREMSHWESGSLISRFNREAGWHDLPPDFFHVLSRALEIARITDGAFDPALGRRMDMLGFGPSIFPVDEPTTARPDESRDPGTVVPREVNSSSKPGQVSPSALDPDFRRDVRDKVQASWRDIQLDVDRRRAFQPGGVALDLSSIAKGHAVDMCAERLRALGAPSFLMEIGGEFVGQGVKPDGHPWWVALELSDVAPAPGEAAETDVALVNMAVATSGDFVRRREGISHLLDGRTGTPVRNALSGVAVMHANCMEADGWATALFALGLDAGLAMADAQGLAAAFAVRAEDGARTQFSAKAREMLG